MLSDKERFELEMMDTPQLAAYIQQHVELLRHKEHEARLTGFDKEGVRSLRRYINRVKQILQSRQMKMF